MTFRQSLVRHVFAVIGLALVLFSNLSHAERVYHHNISAFAVGDLVLSKDGDIGEVVGFEQNKLLIDGRWIIYDEYAPNGWVKQVRSLDGIRVGSLVPDGVGGHGKIIRIWEDGRIHIEGRRFDSTPYKMKDFDASTFLPPEEPSGLLKRCGTILGGLPFPRRRG